MRTVGLTGGIGSGKSTVSRLLAGRGAIVFDADAITRELQRPGEPVFDAIVRRFGPGVVADDGSLDRKALAELAFGDPAVLAELEGIIHPAVAEAMTERLASVPDDVEVVILEVPLLLEAAQHEVAGVLVVDCPVETAILRLVEHRGMSEGDVRARLARQLSREERLARADFVVDNSGPLEQLPPQVETAWAWMRSLPER